MNRRNRGMAWLVFGIVLTSASPLFARGGVSNADPPWNPDHLDRLPEEVRGAVLHFCGQPPSAAHYFATYSADSQSINLHFEHLHCQTNKALCTHGGCLHQVYGLRGGHYRLLRHFYGPRND